MSESSNGFMAYTGAGVGVVRGETEERRSWDVALLPLLRRAEYAPAGVEFVPFSLESSANAECTLINRSPPSLVASTSGRPRQA